MSIWSLCRQYLLTPFPAVLLLPAALPSSPGALDALDATPLLFELNVGQTHPSVRYVSRGRGYTLFLTPEEAVLSLHGPAGHPGTSAQEQPQRKAEQSRSVVRMRWGGGPQGAVVAGETVSPARRHYLLGNHPRAWRHNVTTFERVRYSEVNPGIDLVFYGSQGQLEHDFIVAPGARPDVLRVSWEGVASARLDADGNLILETAAGRLLQRKPVAYQDIAGVRTPVEARFRFEAPAAVRFELGPYDPAHRLVIDPILDYSTYLGGSGLDAAYAVAVDASGAAYVAGTTQSLDFPIAGNPVQNQPPPATLPGDIFVTKFKPDGSTPEYSTYIGGDRDDAALAIAVDGGGNVYLAGKTSSTNLPVSPGAIQGFLANPGDVETDAFIMKLNPAGSALLYSTYLGGAENDVAYALALDSTGNAYVAGETNSDNFRTTINSHRPGWCGRPTFDAFVAKINRDATALEYSTYLCGSQADRALGIAVDGAGFAVVTGETISTDFPVRGNALKSATDGAQADGFVSRLSPPGQDLVYSSFLGGSDADAGRAVAVDAAGFAYVAGSTLSTDFPVTPGAFQPKHADGGEFEDAFLAKLDLGTAQPVFATYLGGANLDRANALALDAAGNAYVAGQTASADFPTTPSRCQTGYAGREDAFLAKLTATGSGLVYGLHLGGTENDRAFGVALDISGRAYLAGQTFSRNFRTTPGAFQDVYAAGMRGVSDAFLARVVEAEPPPGPCIGLAGIVNAASFLPGPVSPGEMVSLFGSGIGPSTLTYTDVIGDRLSNNVANTQVLFDGVPAALIYVWDTQVTALVPYSVAGKQTTLVEVQRDGVSTGQVPVAVTASAPGIYTVNFSGTGQGAILNDDSVTPNSPQTPARRESVVVIYTTGEGQTDPPGVDGKINPTVLPLPEPVLPVSVQIAGLEASVEYAGAAPGFAAGLLQVNARIPAGIIPGDAVPVVIKVGESFSQASVTLAAE